MSEELYKERVNALESEYRQKTIRIGVEDEQARMALSEAIYRITKEYLRKNFSN